MPGVLDTFVIQIGLDPAGFKRGAVDTIGEFKKLTETFKRHGTDLEGIAKGITEQFLKVSEGVKGAGIALGGFAAAVGAAKAISDPIRALNQQLGLLAGKTGMSVNEINAWQPMVIEAGGSAEDATSSIEASTKSSSKDQS